MTDESLKYVAGNYFKESRFSKYEDKYTGKLWYKSCYFSAFIEGVRFYANKLYNEGSIFDIVNSIRHTANIDEWKPLEGFERTILTVLDEYDKNFVYIEELKKKVTDKINEANLAIANAKLELAIKDKKIKELEEILIHLKKNDYSYKE